MTEAKRAAALADEIETATVIIEPFDQSPRKLVHPTDRWRIILALRLLAEAEARPAGDLQEPTEEMIEAGATAKLADDRATHGYPPCALGDIDDGCAGVYRHDAALVIRAALASGAPSGCAPVPRKPPEQPSWEQWWTTPHDRLGGKRPCDDPGGAATLLAGIAHGLPA